MGPAGSGSAVTSELLLSPYAADAPRTLGVAPGQNADTVLSDELDAAFTISGIPHDEVARATREGARLVHVSGPEMDRLRSVYPFFRSAVIPAGTYANQRESIHTLSIDIVLLTRMDLDAALVRRLTAALFQMLPRLSVGAGFSEGHGRRTRAGDPRTAASRRHALLSRAGAAAMIVTAARAFTARAHPGLADVRRGVRAGADGEHRSARHDPAVHRLSIRQLPAVQRSACQGLRAADAGHSYPEVETTGSLDNIQALQDGTIDIGLSQAGIAYMAYNGQLRELAAVDARHSRHRGTQFLRGAAAGRSPLAYPLD